MQDTQLATIILRIALFLSRISGPLTPSPHPPYAYGLLLSSLLDPPPPLMLLPRRIGLRFVTGRTFFFLIFTLTIA